jgi:hypothetical protein
MQDARIQDQGIFDALDPAACILHHLFFSNGSSGGISAATDNVNAALDNHHIHGNYVPEHSLMNRAVID